MHPYHVLLTVTCVACAVLGTFVLGRDVRETSNRLASAVILGGAWWSFSELLWTQAATPEAALFWVRLSTLGWVWIGPLGLQLLIEVVGDREPRHRLLLRALYAASAVCLVVDWTTPLLHPGMLRTEWGWSYQLGWLYPTFYVGTVTAVLYGLVIARRAYLRWPSEAERSQARGIAVGIMVPLFVASVTDGLLPYAGIHLWHFGAASIAVLGATVAFTFYRYGYSLLAPGTFARQILETMTDGLALLHLDGRIRRANPALVRMTGARDVEELLRLNIDRLIPALAGTARGDAADGERVFVPLAGPSFPVSVATATLADRRGAPTGLVVLAHDLREVVDLRQRLVISGRMVAVGQLAAGVAHELNNPMAYVRANLSLLLGHFAKLGRALRGDREDGGAEQTLVDECGELLEESIEGIDRATAIIRDIKSFSHAGTGRREATDLRALLDATQRMVEPQIRHRATIARHDAELPIVRCAPREIQQVLVNLLLNAADARDPRDPAREIRIRIETGAEAGQVFVDVADDGAGIDPEVLPRIFDPFYTTKPAGEGTGLGLSISYEIVRRHGGELRVDSSPGAGARFRLTLPVEPAEAPAPGT